MYKLVLSLSLSCAVWAQQLISDGLDEKDSVQRPIHHPVIPTQALLMSSEFRDWLKDAPQDEPDTVVINVMIDDSDFDGDSVSSSGISRWNGNVEYTLNGKVIQDTAEYSDNQRKHDEKRFAKYEARLNRTHSFAETIGKNVLSI